MVNKKTWKEFRESGLLWWINMILHTFGWAICCEVEEDGSVSEVYPSRVTLRGFDEKNNTEGYVKGGKFMKDNAEELFIESES